MNIASYYFYIGFSSQWRVNKLKNKEGKMAQPGLRCELELPFAKIIILHDDIADVIVNDGVDIA